MYRRKMTPMSTSTQVLVADPLPDRHCHDSAGCRADDALDHVVGMVDGGYLVGHDLDDEKDGDYGYHPPGAEDIQGLAQAEPSKTLGEGDGHERYVGVQTGRDGKAQSSQDIHDPSPLTPR